MLKKILLKKSLYEKDVNIGNRDEKDRAFVACVSFPSEEGRVNYDAFHEHMTEEGFVKQISTLDGETHALLDGQYFYQSLGTDLRVDRAYDILVLVVEDFMNKHEIKELKPRYSVMELAAMRVSGLEPVS